MQFQHQDIQALRAPKNYLKKNIGGPTCIKKFISSCSTSAQRKTPHFPAGKLLPLPTPQRPWAHMAVDFLTNLPKCQGNSVNLIVTDHFSQSIILIPLPALASTLDLEEVVFKQVFRYFGLPEKIVSDRGPQFMSQV